MKPTLLVILDGFGYRPDKEHNAIAQAHTPALNLFYQQYPHTLLKASGPAVGLLEQHIGNSEVGHLTIGAGRIIKQPMTRIHESILNKTFFSHELLTKTLSALKNKGGSLHLVGLLSDAGIHSDLEHLYAYLEVAHTIGISSIYIHAILDGRDVPPQSAAMYLSAVDACLKNYPAVVLGSLHGRFYAMDRDNNWDRIEKSYEVLTQVQASTPQSWQTVLERYYAQDITDEFIPPTQLNAASVIRDGDGIIFFNTRADRARQLACCFVDPNFNKFPVTQLNLSFFITPTEYGMPTKVLFPTPDLFHTLKDELASARKSILSIAETEKYAHVTYFFTGQREKAVATEMRILIPSIKAPQYRDYPCMSANEITDAVIDSLRTDPKDFYLINYANADMVGHSGDLQATIQAIECLDQQLGRLYEIAVRTMGGTIYITADHGKAEDMWDAAAQQPRTAHTNNLVPFIMVKEGLKPDGKLPLYQLSDIAPFILNEMGLEIPEEMVQKSSAD